MIDSFGSLIPEGSTPGPLPTSSLSARGASPASLRPRSGVTVEYSHSESSAACEPRAPNDVPANPSSSKLLEVDNPVHDFDKARLPDEQRKIPGKNATSLRIHSFWMSLTRNIKESGAHFAKFLQALLRQPLGASRKRQGSTTEPWPMPLPYRFEESEDDVEVQAFKRLLNLQIAFLNYVSLGRPSAPPAEICGHVELSALQLSVVNRMYRLGEAWNSHRLIEAEQMGRVAAKQEQAESVLEDLNKFARPVVAGLKEYHKVVRPVSVTKPANVISKKVGKLSKGDVSGANPIIASRIKMEGAPSFDPTPFLDEASKLLYQEPWSSGITPADVPETPPRVHVHASLTEKIALLEKLEATHRLGFRGPSDVVEGFGNGLFSVPKNTQVDRLILDGRPANLLQEPPNRFIYTMASAITLLNIHLGPHEKLVMSGDDLSNFFYTFSVGEQRIARNFLEWKIPISIAKKFKTFPAALKDQPYVYACLATLAMGDGAACEYAQTSHVSLGLQCGAFTPEQLVTLHGRIPRGPYMAGIIIDDLVFLEKIAINAVSGDHSQQKRGMMHKMYSAVGLDVHPDKGFSEATTASFWGADVDGLTGLIRANIPRAISLCWVTRRIATMKICSISLLEVVAGGFVSLFGFRKRLLSLLDLIYVVQGGRDQRDVITLPDELVDELWSCIILAPLAVTDLRAGFGDTVFMVDASNWGEAVVECQVPTTITEELCRNCLVKSAWTHLLTPYKASLRAQGILPPEQELPEGEQPYRGHPLWETAARGYRYKLSWKQKAKRGRHINVGELKSYVKAEAIAGLRGGDCRVPIGSDSQVSLGCTIKGRSASSALNHVLRQSLPMTLGFGVYSFSGYIPSALNPSDDPTRGVAIRDADIEFPDWWTAMTSGDFDCVDEFLEYNGLGNSQTCGYPNLAELSQNVSDAAVGIKAKSRCARWHASVKHKLVVRKKLKQEAQLGTQAVHMDDGNGLPTSVISALVAFGKEQFIFGSDHSWPPRQAGFIDLYSGKKGFAREASKLGAPWILCVDILDGPQCDLLLEEVRNRINLVLREGGCICLTAAPICSSFSRAITPCVRSKLHPRGLPHVMGDMLRKILDGNSHSLWLSTIVKECKKMRILYWIENPDSSFLWSQPEWEALQSKNPKHFFKVDFCTYKTLWRKRTRFLTNTRLRNSKRLCRGGHQHLILRGRSQRHKMCWTKVAEPYPRALCRALAHAVCADLDLVRNKETVCSFTGHLRVGEAKNPGPARRNAAPKDAADLDGVELIRSETVALGKHHWQKFLCWLAFSLGEDACDCIWIAPELCGNLLAGYGKHWYGEGGALYAFRHLVVYAQRTHPIFKGKLQEAWNLINKWEELEPVTHRRPLPLVVVQAMVVLAIHWGWLRVACIILITFHACARPGEVLKAQRRHLVLGIDIGEPDNDVCFLQINKPKPGRRGLGRVQHARVKGLEVCLFLTKAIGALSGSEMLYPGSAGSFRTRWNHLLRKLCIPVHFNLTPGCLRAGGTVHLYRTGTPIMDILWFLRLKNIETLQHYLQEISTEVTMIDMPDGARQLIRNVALLFPHMLSALQL